MKFIYHLLISACLPFVLQAQTVDNTFGTNGVFISSFGTTLEEGLDFVIQPDGKAILLGNTNYDPDEGSNSRILVIRLNENGRLDNTFGTNGVAYIDFPNESNTGNSIALQSDGKIIIVGQAGIIDAAVYRLTSVGNLDLSFNSTGKRLFSGTTIVELKDVTVLNDGKILACGNGFLYPSGSTPRWSTVVTKLNTDGSLDNTFNGTGYNNFKISSTASEEDEYGGQSLALQSDGKIVVCGSLARSQVSPDVYVARLNANGSLDQSFGPLGGKKIFNMSGDQTAVKVNIDGDGKIIVFAKGCNGSCSSSANIGNFIYRLLPNGNDDDTFNNTGSGFYSWLGYANAAELSSTGHIYIANGSAKTQLFRINPNGTSGSVLGQNNPLQVAVSRSDAPIRIQLQGNSLYIIGSATPTSVSTDKEIYFLKIINLPSISATQETYTHFRVFPNPTSSQLILDDKEGLIMHVNITDLAGKQFMEKAINEKQATIDIANLPNGLYFVTTETTDGRRGVQKFIKN